MFHKFHVYFIIHIHPFACLALKKKTQGFVEAHKPINTHNSNNKIHCCIAEINLKSSLRLGFTFWRVLIYVNCNTLRLLSMGLKKFWACIYHLFYQNEVFFSIFSIVQWLNPVKPWSCKFGLCILCSHFTHMFHGQFTMKFKFCFAQMNTHIGRWGMWDLPHSQRSCENTNPTGKYLAHQYIWIIVCNR